MATDITTLTPAQIGALAPADLAAYSAEELGQMTPEQVAALTQEQMAALDSDQLAAIAPVIEAYQELIGNFQAVQSAAAMAARAAFLKPITDLLAMPEYDAVKAAVQAIGNDFSAENFAGALNCLKTGFRSLSSPLPTGLASMATASSANAEPA